MALGGLIFSPRRSKEVFAIIEKVLQLNNIVRNL